MISAAIAFLLANLPMLAAFTGPAGMVVGLAAKFMPNAKTWLIVGAVVLGIVTVAGAAVHYMKLVDAADDWRAIQPKIAAQEQSLGCPARPAEERDLFACIPARERDAATARADTERKAAQAVADAQTLLQAKAEQLQHDLNAAEDAIADASDADDGPVPKVMRDYWTRERTQRGIK